MQVYVNRKDSEYLNRIKELLSFENLKNSAIHLPKAKTIKGKTYHKFIRIDIHSYTASILLDASCNLDKNNFYSEFKALLFNNAEFHKAGIFVKVRFLLEYPHSTSSYNRIQAESSFLRASVDQPSFSRDFQLVDQLDEQAFSMSFSIVLQRSNLLHLENIERELRQKFNWNSNQNPSSITLKFSPSPIGSCFLIINDKLFYDPYLYAKANSNDNKLTLEAPVVELNENIDKRAFESFEDHFRYLWELDTTLDCDDATYYIPDKLKSLANIRGPQAISFENKANKICAITKTSIDDKVVRTWKKLVTNNFRKVCTDLSPSIANETIFITCSWAQEQDGIASPNHYAEELNRYLTEDFIGNEGSHFSVQIMQAVTSEFISNQLYQSLDSSTIGLILMTKDIRGENKSFYCRPNVYHELGYLMKHLGKRRVLILKEQDVETPSNINDFVRFDFHSERIFFRYHDILEQLMQISSMNRQTFANALDAHVLRLNRYLQVGKITSEESQALRSKIQNLKSKY